MTPPEAEQDPAPVESDKAAPRWGGVLGHHARALLAVLFASLLGIVATALFQVTMTRGLGPGDYGLLAAFLGIINVAAVGSTALRNAVAVGVAEGPSDAAAPRPARRMSGTTFEALVTGLAFALVLVLFAPLLADALGSSVIAPLLAAATIVPYMFFARSLGILQGARRTLDVVWWTTGLQIIQFLLSAWALAMGMGVLSILAVYLAVIVIGTVWSSFQARRIPYHSDRRAFDSGTVVVLVLTLAFAWLTNIDVALVRGFADPDTAGAYAAGAVLVKLTLILPTTLSLYLLPRFVSSNENLKLSRLGVNLSLAVTAAGGALIALGLWLVNDLVVAVVFGGNYEETARLLPLMALAWLPWALAQAVLVRITALRSKSGLVALSLAVVAQLLLAVLFLPDVGQFIAANGAIGLTVFLALLVIHLRMGAKHTTDA